jgi:hypothetical protein
MSIKIKQAITECLERIATKEFDEETIRTLLIVSREYLHFDGLIKELAHFIAHPKRNKGLFHKSVNTRYTKLKLIDEQVLSTDFSKISATIKTEDELSNFMLAGVDIDKIEAKLFEILYHDGLDDQPEDHLIKYTGHTKIEARKILKEHYTKTNGFYYLNVLKTEKLIALNRSIPDKDPSKEKELNKTMKEAEEVVKRIRTSIDSLQKVIRGAIHFRSVFQTNELTKDFRINFEKILIKFEIENKFIAEIENNIQHILVCLMTLLHDSSFVFYDKNIANVFLCFYCEPSVLENQNKERTTNQNLYKSGVLALYTNYKYRERSNIFPLYVSEIPISSVVDKDEFLNNEPIETLRKIPWISAKRRGSRFRLEKYS